MRHALNKLIVVNPSKFNINILSVAATMRDIPDVEYARSSDDVSTVCRKYEYDENTRATIVYNAGGRVQTKYWRGINTRIYDDVPCVYKAAMRMGSRARMFIMSPGETHEHWQEYAKRENMHIKLTDTISPFIIDKMFHYTRAHHTIAEIMKTGYNMYANACSGMPYNKYLEYYKVSDVHKIRERVYPSMRDFSDDVNPTIHEYIEIMNYSAANKHFKCGAYDFMHAYRNTQYTDVLFLKDPDGYIRLDVIMRGREIERVLHHSKIYDNFQEIARANH